MLRRLAALAALALLAACPEERPGAQRQVPAQRVPPAMSVEIAPVDAGAAPAAQGDAGAPAR